MKNRIINRDRGALSVIGKIKIGKKNEQKGYPMSLDYFRPTGNYASVFNQQLGEKPNKILIFFPSNNACTQAYTLYADGALVGMSDGISVKHVVNEKGKKVFKTTEFMGFEDAEQFRIEYANSFPKNQKSKLDWKLNLSLKFMLGEIRNISGFWSFSTNGAASMVNQIANTFDETIDLLGGVVGVPFWLSVEKVKHKSATVGVVNFPVVTLSRAVGIPQLMELRGYSGDMAALIDNSIKAALPESQHKALPTLPELSEQKIQDAHEAIENDKMSVKEVIDNISGKFVFDIEKITTPRASYLQSLADSIDDAEQVDLIYQHLQAKGYKVTDVIKQKIIDFCQ